MTMLTHARSPLMLQRLDGRDASVSIGTPHLAMIGRFVLGMLLFMAVVTGIMAVRVVAWFPHFHQ